MVRFVGIFTSFLIPETARKTLEELTGMPSFVKANPAGEEGGKSPVESDTAGIGEPTPTPEEYGKGSSNGK